MHETDSIFVSFSLSLSFLFLSHPLCFPCFVKNLFRVSGSNVSSFSRSAVEPQLQMHFKNVFHAQRNCAW